MKILAICSGGMDSTTMVYDAASKKNREVGMVTFDYGQRHKIELEYANRTAQRLNCPHYVIELPIGSFLKGSALTDRSVKVPEVDYSNESLAVTVVPNRNAMMLSVACAIAAANGYEKVYAGMHGGDHAVYPDCRPEFVDAFDKAMVLACGVHVTAPYVSLTKMDIAGIGARLNVPYEDTYSCYNGREQHCGICSTCRERIRAIEGVGLVDPTEYEQH